MAKSVFHTENNAPGTLMSQLVEEWDAMGNRIKDQCRMINELRHDRSDLRDNVNSLNDRLSKESASHEEQTRLREANRNLRQSHNRLINENTALIERITELLHRIDVDEPVIPTVDEDELRYLIARTLDKETLAGIKQCQDIAQAIIDMLIEEGIANQLE